MPELSLPQSAPYVWRGFSAGTSEAEARAAFRERYGCEPAVVGRSLGIVLAGPVPADKVRG